MKKILNHQTKIKNYKFGLWAEKMVIFLLFFQGYNILKHRYQGYFGEIDIIAKRFKTIVFIEVKARQNFKEIEEVLNPYQIKRIKKSAEVFINENPKLQNLNYRFDLIAVNKNFRIKFFRGFFNW